MHDRTAVHHLAEAADRRPGLAVIHSGLIDPLPNPIEGSHGIGRRIEGFPAIEFVGRENLGRRRAAVFLSGPHHGFGNFQGVVALALQGMHRAVLGGQDDSIPDDFQGLVPIGLAGGDLFGSFAPLRLQFVAAEPMLPVDVSPRNERIHAARISGLAFAIALVAALRH